MRYKNLILGVGLAVLSQLAAATALADIPPPGLCDGSAEAGEACDEPVDTAGKPVEGDGACVAEKCTRGTPDGTLTYDCLMCRAAKTDPDPAVGGAGGAPVDPDEPGGKGGSSSQPQAGSAGKAGSSTSKPKEDDEGGGYGEGGGSGNDLYDQAVAVVTRDRKASTSYIQRRLQIGYNRAASLMEQMEREGVVGPANHAGKRDILAGPPPV